MNDEEIRKRLAPLRAVPIPPVPTIVPLGVPRRESSWGRWIAAAVMLLALPAVLYLLPPRDAGGTAALSARISSVESRLLEIRDDELRALVRREIELLRAELRIVESRGYNSSGGAR